eukprot:TRINITY_DN10689_c0_g5_i2.p1 TRINITY_DN10689_c0_g5~~TRINITY_DN10689_c0_g5_i2.p1  ORF type:complete len:202 (-),score=34.50 TRINITY_DN10689_c0_g5_i2:64-669(-)
MVGVGCIKPKTLSVDGDSWWMSWEVSVRNIPAAITTTDGIGNYWGGVNLTDFTEKISSRMVFGWHHVAVTYNSEIQEGDNHVIYFDGNVQGKNKQRADLRPSDTNAWIGRSTRGGAEEYFIGFIRDVRIWKSCLGSSQIKRNMHQLEVSDDTPDDKGGPSRDLVVRFLLNEGIGSVVTESVSGQSCSIRGNFRWMQTSNWT